MKKKCKIVLLPINKTYGAIEYDPQDKKYSVESKQYHHKSPHELYILSDDEIKDNDYFIENNNIFQAYSNFVRLNMDKTILKIIATTDSSLVVKDFDTTYKRVRVYLPSIPQSFIDKYVSEYNKGNKIEEVMIEYKGFDNLNSMNDSSITGWIPKLNPDNTINISAYKDSWNKDELNKEAMMFYTKYHGILNQGDMQSIAKFINEL